MSNQLKPTFGIALTAASVAIIAACVAGPTSPTISTTLDDANKSLKFTMVKDGTTPVNGSFKTFTLALSKKAADIQKPSDLNDLTAKVEVGLAADNVNTGNTTRDGNIATHYFDATKYSAATFTFKKFTLDQAAESFTTGQALAVTAEAEFDLHGVKKPLTGVKLNLTPVDGGFQIQTTEDLSVKSSDYAIDVANLLAACGHKSIAEAATVSFDVTVKK